MQNGSTSNHSFWRGRELQTIEVMIGMYCSGHRHQQGHVRSLCPKCQALLVYAERRLERCVFGEAKPTCAKCLVHCYSADKREKIRLVMQWAGPRMLLRHPLRAIFHLLAGRRLAPSLPVKPDSNQVKRFSSQSDSASESTAE